MKKINIQTIAGLAVFSAVVIVLQLLGSFIRFGTFSVSLVLIPIVVGAALYGKGAGAWLGLVFGLTVLLSGDAALFLGFDAFGTVITVLAKGVLAGFAAGVVFRLLAQKNTVLATVLSAIVCPVVNTGIFFLGCIAFFYDDIAGLAAADSYSGSVITYVLLFFIGGNFLFEILFNVVLCPIVTRILKGVGAMRRA